MSLIKRVEHTLDGVWKVLVVDITGNMPHSWIAVSTELITGIEKLKGFISNPAIVTLAQLFPNGIGNVALGDIANVLNEALPTLEIMQGCEQSISGITDPILKADALVQYLASNMNKLPANWQKTHWATVLSNVLAKLLNLSENQAFTIIALQLEKAA